MKARARPKDVDGYISLFPPEVRARLESLRAAILEAAPEAEEAIAYGMPTFRQDGNLVHFAAYPGHIGFYPAPSGIARFRRELARYPSSKGAVRFPVDGRLPLGLVRRIVRFRVRENAAARAERKAVARRRGQARKVARRRGRAREGGK